MRRESRTRRRRALGRAGVRVGNRSTSGFRSGPHEAVSIAAAVSIVGTSSAQHPGPQTLSTAVTESPVITGTEITPASSPGGGNDWARSDPVLRLRSVSAAPAGPRYGLCSCTGTRNASTPSSGTRIPTSRVARVGVSRSCSPSGTLMATITATSEWMVATEAARSSGPSARTTSSAAASALAMAGRRCPRRVRAVSRGSSIGRRTRSVWWGPICGQ